MVVVVATYSANSELYCSFPSSKMCASYGAGCPSDARSAPIGVELLPQQYSTRFAKELGVEEEVVVTTGSMPAALHMSMNSNGPQPEMTLLPHSQDADGRVHG